MSHANTVGYELYQVISIVLMSLIRIKTKTPHSQKKILILLLLILNIKLLTSLLKKMCLAIPGKIISIKEHVAKVDFDGIKKTINTSLLDNVQKGDFVLVHVGFAIQKVDNNKAKETYRLLWNAFIPDKKHISPA